MCDAPARSEGCVSIKNFAETAESVCMDLLAERLEEAHRCGPVFVNAQVGMDKGTEKPSPHGALVV